MKVIGSMFVTLLVILVLLGISGALVFLIAYGLAWAIQWIAGFDLFQATLLAIASIAAAGFLASRIWEAVSPASIQPKYDEFDDDDEFDDEFEEFFEDDDDDEEETPNLYPGIPRWRQPLKTLDFSNTKPNDRCPCGSGRKFKNCHGIKHKAN